MKSNKILVKVSTFLIILAFAAASAFSQTTEFSYQGFLSDNSASANGNFDFEFRLYDAAAGGNLLGTIQRTNVPVTNGVFSATLDFPSQPFTGGNRFMEISVKPAGGGSFTPLAPRQKILSAPYAIFSNVAQTSIDSTRLGNVPANQFVLTGDARLNDARNPLPNSTNYVQNRTTPQTSTNFNISGDGTIGGTLTGGIVSFGTQLNSGNNRVLGKVGQNNLFLGTLTGAANGGIQNTLIGDAAGQDNTGNENAFFGFVAGQRNTTGINNTFVGSRAGKENTLNTNNTFIGYLAGGTNNLTNATALGSNAFVESSNSLVLGSINGKNSAVSDTNVGIGTATPDAPLDIVAQLPNSPPNIPNLRLTNYGRFSLIRGRSARGTRNNPSATQAGDSLFVITADGNTGNGFTGLGQATIFFSATENWTNSANGTSIVFNTTPNGSTSEANRMIVDQNGFVGIGNMSPARKLDVDGIIRVGSVSGTVGCIEDRDGTVIAGTCSSDARFKKNITPFGNVLTKFSRLQPVNYFWRADEFADRKFGDKQSYGLIAQEVEMIFPELVSTDEQGFKMINYSKLPLLTIQAVKELKAENDALKLQLDEQRKELEELKKFVYREAAETSKSKKGDGRR